MNLRPIRQALISLSDKQGALELAQALAAFGVKLLSTDGTAKLIREAGLAVTEIGDYTGFPEMLDGRVKTLHPKVHGGILARRDLALHLQTIVEHDIEPIDLVCVNLYPFRETVAKTDVSLAEAIENIDIGGPAMLRSAAKNYEGVAVLTDPADYSLILAEMQQYQGALSAATRFKLAKKAFVHTARYDSAIANWLTALDENHNAQALSEFPAQFQLAFDRVETLRYGENPHQSAAFYRDAGQNAASTIAAYQQIQGKALSYNNIADADAAWECVKSFAAPACVIIKHANPCGVAIAENLSSAYVKAFQTDSTSAFGGIIAFNRTVDADVVLALNERKHFVEVIIAPGYTQAAQDLLSAKANLRVLSIPIPLTGSAVSAQTLEMKRVGGGLLVQTSDAFQISASDLKIVTKIAPTQQQIDDLLFAWRVAKFVKSNAIVFCANNMTLGVGAGQMSRVDSTRIACIKAANAQLSLTGSCVASDAFFPFRDGLDVIAAAGAAAIIQPGGSLRDDEVIAAANEHGLAMVFTGVRHFRH